MTADSTASNTKSFVFKNNRYSFAFKGFEDMIKSAFKTLPENNRTLWGLSKEVCDRFDLGGGELETWRDLVYDIRVFVGASSLSEVEVSCEL